MKIAKNNCFGGFGLSKKAVMELNKLGIKLDVDDEGNNYHLDNKDFGIESDDYNAYRADKRLIEVIEKLGDEANTRFSSLSVEDIPDDVDWEIDEYDGMETIHEKHRSW